MNEEGSDELRRAIEAVRNLGLDPQTAGGAVALAHLLGETTVSGPARARPQTPPTPSDGDRAEARLADWARTDEDRIRDLVVLSDGRVSLTLSVARLPRSKADRQRLLTLLLLAVERVGLGVDETPARRVNDVCREYSCLDQNLAMHVASRGDLVTRRGKRGSYSYRVTQPGLQRAREVFAELVDGNDEVYV